MVISLSVIFFILLKNSYILLENYLILLENYRILLGNSFILLLFGFYAFLCFIWSPAEVCQFMMNNSSAYLMEDYEKEQIVTR